MYLDYLNNFITINGFAEHHNITRVQAIAAITAGKKEHENLIARRKQNNMIRNHFDNKIDKRYNGY